jgi:hypothetical protein
MTWPQAVATIFGMFFLTVILVTILLVVAFNDKNKNIK